VLSYAYDARVRGKRRGFLLFAITIDHRATLKALPGTPALRNSTHILDCPAQVTMGADLTYRDERVKKIEFF